MKKISMSFCLLLCALIVGYTSCKKEDDKKNNCYTCTNCQGQYGHLLNGEKCSEDFDNKEDWEAHKKAMIEENGCKCE